MPKWEATCDLLHVLFMLCPTTRTAILEFHEDEHYNNFIASYCGR